MDKYPALQTAARLARIIGWLGLFIAGLLFLYGLYQLVTGLSATDTQTADQATSILGLVAGGLKVWAALSLAFVSLILVLVGESVQVFIDIEANTRLSCERLRVADPRAEPPGQPLRAQLLTP